MFWTSLRTGLQYRPSKADVVKVQLVLRRQSRKDKQHSELLDETVPILEVLTIVSDRRRPKPVVSRARDDAEFR